MPTCLASELFLLSIRIPTWNNSAQGYIPRKSCPSKWPLSNQFVCQTKWDLASAETSMHSVVCLTLEESLPQLSGASLILWFPRKNSSICPWPSSHTYARSSSLQASFKWTFWAYLALAQVNFWSRQALPCTKAPFSPSSLSFSSFLAC